MIYRYLVTVETDDAHVDAPTEEEIANELQSTLEYGQQEFGIVAVTVSPDIVATIQAFLRYSFGEIHYAYDGLTEMEQAMCSHARFNELVGVLDLNPFTTPLSDGGDV